MPVVMSQGAAGLQAANGSDEAHERAMWPGCSEQEALRRWLYAKSGPDLPPAFLEWLAQSPDVSEAARSAPLAFLDHAWGAMAPRVLEAGLRGMACAALWGNATWDSVFGELMPKASQYVLKLLNLFPAPISTAPYTAAPGESTGRPTTTPPEGPPLATVHWGSNSHELVWRAISCLMVGQEAGASLVLLTTDTEFYSLTRQLNRLVTQRFAKPPAPSAAAAAATGITNGAGAGTSTASSAANGGSIAGGAEAGIRHTSKIGGSEAAASGGSSGRLLVFNMRVEAVPAEPTQTLTQRLLDAVRALAPDVVYVSHITYLTQQTLLPHPTASICQLAQALHDARRGQQGRPQPQPGTPAHTPAAPAANSAGSQGSPAVPASIPLGPPQSRTHTALAPAAPTPRHPPLLLVDGYHSFLALPLDLRRAYLCAPVAEGSVALGFVTGLLKHAGCGPNAAFLVAGVAWAPRPLWTGWLADVSVLGPQSHGIRLVTSSEAEVAAHATTGTGQPQGELEPGQWQQQQGVGETATVEAGQGRQAEVAEAAVRVGAAAPPLAEAVGFTPGLELQGGTPGYLLPLHCFVHLAGCLKRGPHSLAGRTSSGGSEQAGQCAGDNGSQEQGGGRAAGHRWRITVSDIHSHVMGLQEGFVKGLRRLEDGRVGGDGARTTTVLSCRQLVNWVPGVAFDAPQPAEGEVGTGLGEALPPPRSHTLVFKMGSPEEAAQVVAHLAAHGVAVDARKGHLRVGFGFNHGVEDVQALLKAVCA